MVAAVAIIAVGALWLYLNVVATIVVVKAPTYAALQRAGQLLIAWAVPFIGALVVLRVAYDSLPGDRAFKLIPWPLKGLVVGEELPPNPNADRRERPNFWSGGFPRGH